MQSLKCSFILCPFTKEHTTSSPFYSLTCHVTIDGVSSHVFAKNDQLPADSPRDYIICSADPIWTRGQKHRTLHQVVSFYKPLPCCICAITWLSSTVDAPDSASNPISHSHHSLPSNPPPHTLYLPLHAGSARGPATDAPDLHGGR